MLTGTVFYLSTHPGALAALQDEVTPLITSGEFDMRNSLTVLSSIITETLRLQPVIPSDPERMTPLNGLTTGNALIPGNIVVRVPNYTICRNDRYFVHPNEFIPECWTTKPDLAIDSGVCMMFGSGAYHCVGSRLGLMEIRAALAHLAARFSWKLSNKTHAEAFERSGKDHFALVFGPLYIDFESRRSVDLSTLQKLQIIWLLAGAVKRSCKVRRGIGERVDSNWQERDVLIQVPGAL